MSAPKTGFAILASGSGSNAQALIDACQRGEIDAEIRCVISNVENAGVLKRAQERAIPTEVVPHQGLKRADHERRMLACIERHGVAHLLLAGYMRILSADFLDAFPGSVLNIHPSLLPEFPGLHAQRQQWEAGVPVAGATVHQVDAGTDTGPILLQGSIDVRGDEGADGLAQRILTEVEHVIYPRAVRLFLDRTRRQNQP